MSNEHCPKCGSRRRNKWSYVCGTEECVEDDCNLLIVVDTSLCKCKVELTAAQQTIADLRAEVERLKLDSVDAAIAAEAFKEGGEMPYEEFRKELGLPAPPVPRPPMLRAKPKHLDGYQWFLRGEHYHCWFSEDGRYASEMLEIDRKRSDAEAVRLYESETRPQS